MTDTLKWRVTFDHRAELVYAKDLENAISTASRRVRDEDGQLTTVELYTHGKSNPWGMIYNTNHQVVCPQIQETVDNILKELQDDHLSVVTLRSLTTSLKNLRNQL